jgi:hypothetical protein
MDIAPDLDGMLLFLLLVFPGMISMRVYRLLMPAKDLDWKDSVSESLFFSAINFSLFLPLLVCIHQPGFAAQNVGAYSGLLLLVLLVGPVLIPRGYVAALRCRWLMRGLQIPMPSAWDHFFDRRESLFVLVHLTNGQKIGGYYGPSSYATSYPRQGDLYLEATFAVDSKGRFCDHIPLSRGLLLRSSDYHYMEFFAVPASQPQAATNDDREQRHTTNSSPTDPTS